MHEAYVNKSGRGPKIKDISGQRFNLLTALYPALKRGTTVWWSCRCDCGNIREVPGGSLRLKTVWSCGCVRKTRIGVPRTHGNASGGRTLEYKCWVGMRPRCLDTRDPAYPRYGGRGITVCEQWLGENGFQQFLDDMGRKPSPKHSLDRIDNNGPYSPENCRWATPVEQANNKRNNIRLAFNGEEMTLPQWAEKLGINRDALYARLRICKWSVEKTLTTPLMGVFGNPRESLPSSP